MSGGYFNYSNDYLANDIYWNTPNYGEKGFSMSVDARRRNPFEDKQISELIWDVFCLMHSFDWYRSGDNGQDDYMEDVQYFKNKWLGKTRKEITKREIDLSIQELKEELYRTLDVNGLETVDKSVDK